MISKVTADFRRSQFHFQELIGSLVLAREFPPQGGPVHVAGNH
jgi:hypothetical protein